MNKKGFTLVELLAVIIVLSIIVLITAISTSNIIKNSKKSLSEVQIKSIEKAAKTYYVEEVSNHDNVCVNISELIQKGYIDKEKIANPKNNEEILGSIRISYIDNKYNYEYKDQECIKCTVDKQNENKYTVGDIVTCEFEKSTDKFYIMGDAELTEENIEMLTEKNIHTTNYRQSDNAGTIAFSSTAYWSDETTYPVNVYNVKNDKVKLIVDEYVKYLNQKLIAATGSLVTLEQAQLLGCTSNHCIDTPSWFSSSYGPNYWLANAADSNSVWFTGLLGLFGSVPKNGNEMGENLDSNIGVRPVITLPTSNLK